MKYACGDEDGSRKAYLMVGEDQSIGNHHVLSSASCEDYYFGDVLGRKGFASTNTHYRIIEMLRDFARGVSTNAYTASAFDLSP